VKQEAKTTEPNEGLTAPDLYLKKYLSLKSEFDRLKAEVAEMETAIVHRGSYSTTNYIATITYKKTYPRVPGKKVLEAKYGIGVRDLYTPASEPRPTVLVQAKGASPNPVSGGSNDV